MHQVVPMAPITTKRPDRSARFPLVQSRQPSHVNRRWSVNSRSMRGTIEALEISNTAARFTAQKRISFTKMTSYRLDESIEDQEEISFIPLAVCITLPRLSGKLRVLFIMTPLLVKLVSFLTTLVCRVVLALCSVIAMQTSFHTTSWYTYNSLREYMATEIRLKTCKGLNINSTYTSPGCERNNSLGERTRYLAIHSFFGRIWQSRKGKAATQCCESIS